MPRSNEELLEQIEKFTAHLYPDHRDEVRNEALVLCLEHGVRNARGIRQRVKLAILQHRRQFFAHRYSDVSIDRPVLDGGETLAQRLPDRNERVLGPVPDAPPPNPPRLPACQNPACGQTFKPRKKESRYCSPKCYQAARWIAAPKAPDPARFGQLKQDLIDRQVHGMFARYVVGCRCEACRSAAAKYARDRRIRLKTGESRTLVDCSPARDHISHLIEETNCSIRQIAVCAFTSHPLIRRVLSGRAQRIRAHICERILAITKADLRRLRGAAKRRTRKGMVRAGKYRAKLLELVSQGHTYSKLSRVAFGRNTCLFWNVAHGKQTCISETTASKIQKLYSLLA